MTDFVKVFIETERGSPSLYRWNKKTQCLDVRHTLTNMIRIPYAFGYVPNTVIHDPTTADATAELPALFLSHRKYNSGSFYFGYVVGVLRLTDSLRSTDILLVYPIDDLVDKNMEDIHDFDRSVLQQIEWFFTNHYPYKHAKSAWTPEFLHRVDAVRIYQQSISRWKCLQGIEHTVPSSYT